MKKIVFILICIGWCLNICVFASEKVGSYIDNRTLVVRSEDKGVAILAYYDSNKHLVGAHISENKDGYYSYPLNDSYRTINIWFKETDAVLPVVIEEGTEALVVPTSSPLPTFTPQPTVVPQISENTEYEETSELTGEVSEVCVFTISCKMALEYEGLDETKKAVLPKDGVIFEDYAVEISDGMSIYDILNTIAKENGIIIDGEENYISAINGLGEFDCGALSGWMYCVNGEFHRIPISEYIVSENDEVMIAYTCNMGEDLSAGF